MSELGSCRAYEMGMELAFSPDGKLALTGQTTRQPGSGCEQRAELRQIETGRAIRSIAFSLMDD